ncbi:hypothetical protein U1Q18_045203, partial [Sarracenia purpurea var. burkii]
MEVSVLANHAVLKIEDECHARAWCVCVSWPPKIRFGRSSTVGFFIDILEIVFAAFAGDLSSCRLDTGSVGDITWLFVKTLGGFSPAILLSDSTIQLDAGTRMMGKPEFGFIGHISSGRALSGPASSPGCGRWLR